jgi:Bacterial SH3 domain
MRRSFWKVPQILVAYTLIALPISMHVPLASAESLICYEVTDSDGSVNVRERSTGKVVTQMDDGNRFWSSAQTRDGMIVMNAPHDRFVINRNRLKVIASGRDCDSYTVVDRDGKVNLRKSPNGKIIGTVASDSIVIVLGRSGKWRRILTTDGRIGFIHSSRLQ